MGLFTFLRSRDVLQAHKQPVLNGLRGVVQKNGSVQPDGRPILPANAYQELLSGDIAKLPSFVQWNGIQLDREDLVVSWSVADVSAAFWIFRVQPSWFPWQALAKPVPGSFAAQWCPKLACHDDGVESACCVLQHAHRRLCFAQPPSGASLPTDSEIRRDRALPQTATSWLEPLVTIYLGGMSLAELSAVHQQAVEGTMSLEVATLQEIWSQWRVPYRKKRLSTAPTNGKH